jgi:hypothetical protein
MGEVVAGWLGASDPHERVLRLDAKPGRWSARLGGHRRRGNSTAKRRPGRRRRGGTGDGRQRTGERPGGVVVQGGQGVEAAELGQRSGMVGDVDGARGWRRSRSRTVPKCWRKAEEEGTYIVGPLLSRVKPRTGTKRPKGGGLLSRVKPPPGTKRGSTRDKRCFWAVRENSQPAAHL